MGTKSISKRPAPAPAAHAARDKRANGVSDDERLLEKLRTIVRILEDSSLAELKYEDADVIVSLSRHASSGPISIAPIAIPGAAPMSAVPTIPTAAAISAPAFAPTVPAAAVPAEPARAAPEENIHLARSPFIGTFYRSPTPEAEPFVEIGQRIRRGQTLCIVEAMKLMNEIESEVDGVVLEVFADNGRPVQYGDALFKIKTRE
jgi:acetyl-CoA carboxylase biotin carboxyl carrier protein